MASLCQACSSSSATPLLLAKRVFSLASSPFIFMREHKIPRHCNSFRAFNAVSASSSASTSVCVDFKDLRSNELVELEYAELNLNHKISEVSSFLLSPSVFAYPKFVSFSSLCFLGIVFVSISVLFSFCSK